MEGWRGGVLGVPYRTERSDRNTAQYIPQHTAARQYRTVPILNSHAQSDNRTLKHDRNLRMRVCLVLNTQASLELVEAPLLSPLQLIIPKTLLKVPKSEIPELSRTVNIETCQPFSP